MIVNTVARRVIQSQVLTKVPARTIYPHTSTNIISGPPRVRIPFYEKVAGGVFIATCILATPAYILTHLDNWREPIIQ